MPPLATKCILTLLYFSATVPNNVVFGQDHCMNYAGSYWCGGNVCPQYCFDGKNGCKCWTVNELENFWTTLIVCVVLGVAACCASIFVPTCCFCCPRCPGYTSRTPPPPPPPQQIFVTGALPPQQDYATGASLPPPPGYGQPPPQQQMYQQAPPGMPSPQASFGRRK